ncbi:hypothetical protein D918_03716 [Trichuris suis]|nr:hypothetical protein D918_03716 [Trichuris suis]
MSDTRPEMQCDGQESQDAEESLSAIVMSAAQRNYARRLQRFLARGVSPLVDARRSDETGTRKNDVQSQLQPISESATDQEVLGENFESSQDSNSVFTDSQSQINVSGTPIERQLALRSYQSAVAMAHLKNPQIRSLSASVCPGYSKTPVVGNVVRNPFDPNAIENVCQVMNSPSLFAFKRSEASSNPTFQWSPEQLAKIQPAQLDEDGVSERESYFSPKMERKIQAAIDNFFERGLVHPSPQLRTSASPLELTSVSACESPMATSTTKKQAKTKNAMCQTLFTFPPNFDMDFFLGRTRFRLSDRTLNNEERAFRRKLFTQHHQGDDKLPMDQQFPNSSKSFEGTTPDELSMCDMETALLPVDDRIYVGRSAFYGNESGTMLDSNGRVDSSTPANAAGQKWLESLSTIDLSHDTLTTTNEDKGHPIGSRSLDSGIASGDMTSHDNDM